MLTPDEKRLYDVSQHLCCLSYEKEDHTQYFDMEVGAGPAAGFQVTKSVWSGPLNDINGFVGVLESCESIFVCFRGTTNIQNWYTNLQFTLKDYEFGGPD